MKKRKWVGDVSCRFCPADETISHLFFHCPAAIYMWSVISTSLGAGTRPICFTQFFWWIASFLPIDTNIHVLGIAAFCWAIWKTRNNACFERKFLSSPVQLICYMCVFLRYWAGLQSAGNRQLVEEGAARIQEVAMRAHNAASGSPNGLNEEEDGAEVEDGN